MFQDSREHYVYQIFISRLSCFVMSFFVVVVVVVVVVCLFVCLFSVFTSHD